MSEKLAEVSAPVLFESVVIESKVYEKEVFTANGYKPFYRYLHTREWIDKDGVVIVDATLKKYDWHWTGHYNTHIGRVIYSKRTKACKRGNKSYGQKAENLPKPTEDCPF